MDHRDQTEMLFIICGGSPFADELSQASLRCRIAEGLSRLALFLGGALHFTSRPLQQRHEPLLLGHGPFALRFIRLAIFITSLLNSARDPRPVAVQAVKNGSGIGQTRTHPSDHGTRSREDFCEHSPEMRPV